MSKIQSYSSKGVKLESVEYPKNRTVEPNMNLITQALFIYEDRSHKGTSKTKTRAEVNATTAKMYKQKGTGNARHGARSAPLFAGGGTAHGPHGLKRMLVLSKKLNRRALDMALSLKVSEGKAVIVDKLESLAKTKEAQVLLNTLKNESKLGKGSKILLALSDGKQEVNRVFRNIENVCIDAWKNLNVKQVIDSAFVIIDKDAVNSEPRTGKKVTTVAASSTLKSETKTAKVAKSPVKKVKTVKPTAKKAVRKTAKK